jgi:Flp pilus assembly protein TadD
MKRVAIASIILLLCVASTFALIAGPFTQQELNAATKDPIFYNELGYKLAQEGKNTAAQQAFEQAVALDPAYERARSNLATIAFQNSDYTTAIEHLRVLIAQHPENANYHFDLAQNLASQARYHDADLEKLREAVLEFDKASGVPHAAENAEIIRKIITEFS